MKFDLFGMHKGYDVECPAGEWTTLVNVSFRNYADTYVFSSIDGLAVDGMVRLKSGYLFSSVKELPLESPMIFEKSSFDTTYKIEINPTRDCVMHTPDRDGSAKSISYLLSFWVYVAIIGVLLILKVVFIG